MEVGITIKDQYQVVEHIGRGGMADVWSARDQRLNRLVAIKTIAQSLSADDDPIALFEQEAQTIAQMEHPHILPIYDFGDYRNNLYIVMRYITGGSLEDQLKDDPVSLTDTLAIASNIAQALDYAHMNNVIHLDLKPPNILMDSSGSPYLADFGLATVLDTGGTARNPGSGTLLYMAPEQLVAEVIDHRADIYSFCVMIWHMLTGTLPFDGMIPIAMKQLQFQDELPPLSEFDENIPYQITDILRKGTSADPTQRYNNLAQIVEELHEAADMTSINMDMAWDMGGGFGASFGIDSELTLDIEDVGLLEATDIYLRAKNVWSGGNGRFLLGISHFMMMCDYYIDAEIHLLDLDDAGRQMILRGAIEYNYQIDYWWDQVDEEAQRWVCLHAIRSENAPARIRAFYRLETLPDDEQSPIIPKLVANALAIETVTEAKIAALSVLGTRAKLLKPSQTYNIKTEYRGRLLDTTTRLGIEVLPTDLWQETVYSHEIDLVIADQALNDDEEENVTELAARTIGLIHSLTALRAVADAQRENAPNALRALALIRDEAPYLPDVVTRQARLYAWIANTVRRVADDPMELLLRFVFALVGGSIAFGQHVYITYRNEALFIPQRWGNTLAVGLLMGLFFAVLVMLSHVVIGRLRGFWPNWLRLIMSTALGIFFSILIWTGFTWLYLVQPPLWDLMRVGGLGIAFGLIISTILTIKGWQAVILMSTLTCLSIFTVYFNHCTQLFICFADTSFNPVEGITNFSVAPVAFVGALYGLLLGSFIPRPEPITGAPPVPFYGLSKLGGTILFLILGLGLTTFTYSQILGQAFTTWDHVIVLFTIPMFISAIALVILDTPQRYLYGILSVIGFGAIMLTTQDTLTTIETLIAPQFGEDYIDPLFSYDLFWQSIAVIIPFSLTIAFGAFATNILSDVRRAIGLPTEAKERNKWLSGILLYISFLTALMTILAPFSLHTSVSWAIGWTVVSAGAFICALATWQWKRWGANGLLVFALIFIVGAMLADYRDIMIGAIRGDYPQLFNMQSIITWGAWAITGGIMTVGVMRQRLWGVFGLTGMIALWFIISLFLNDIGDSLTTLAILHLPLIAYALREDWHQFEGGQRKEKAKNEEPTPVHKTAKPPLAVKPLEAKPQKGKSQPVVANTNDLATEVEVGNLILNQRNMATELDAQSLVSAELDTTDDTDDLTNLPTELTPSPLSSESDQDETESVKPKFTLDTSKLKSTDSDADKPKLSIDTSLLKDKPDSKSTRKGLKIDTGALKPKPDSQPTRKGLKIDPSLMKSKEKLTEGSTTSPTRKGLKIDPSLMKSKPATDETLPDINDDEEIPLSTLEETISSRRTAQLSTAEIKKQVAEEEQRQQAEDTKKKSKPKFTLDTSRIKKNDEDDDEK